MDVFGLLRRKAVILKPEPMHMSEGNETAAKTRCIPGEKTLSWNTVGSCVTWLHLCFVSPDKVSAILLCNL
jgi:hypothetical protein